MTRLSYCFALTVILAIASFTGSARAEFVTKYAMWNDLTKTNKALYAAGLIDGNDILGFPDWKNKAEVDYMMPRMDGMNRCISDNKLTGELLAQMIDNAYAADVTRWPLPPVVILSDELGKLCAPWIEKSYQRLHIVF